MSLKLIEKANELIKQTEKEALEIIKKREFIKSKIVDNSIEIDFIVDCLTKKRYSDLTYNERLFVNDIFENATKEDLQVLKDKYFIDLEDIKEIFLTSPYCDDKIFLEILKEYKCK
ncbi:hypothetical protein [Aliarcobacter cryaerophilus]|uniref:hypothetical protein n=1 Tax=Aliarcobacter cryaerophilus TaxID=28198 RepID=UPI0021B58718|nr:hypothetical protein [Aliarcobacter cryaerophilus]MCT7517101.1 hypothetical protein [Aliarcobacter cryaerophilus]